MEFLATSDNGMDVYCEPEHSHAATHFAEAPQLKALTQEIIARTALEGDDPILLETDMGRIVGNTDLVENKPGDVIVFAKRRNRGNIYTSFNKTQQPQPCSVVSVAFKHLNDKKYELVSAWIGPLDSPSFPGEPEATADSKPYWTTHSLVWGTQGIQPGTETPVCPW